MAVRHVAAHVRHVDMPVGMLRVRLGLADEHAALKAAYICVPWSLDDHHGARIPDADLARTGCIARSRDSWPPPADHRRKHCSAFSSE